MIAAQEIASYEVIALEHRAIRQSSESAIH
jgi:hypothetical protein